MKRGLVFFFAPFFSYSDAEYGEPCYEDDEWMDKNGMNVAFDGSSN